MWAHLNTPAFELGIQALHTALHGGTVNRELEIAKAQLEKFFVGQSRPRKRFGALHGMRRAPGGGGAAASGLCQRLGSFS